MDAQRDAVQKYAASVKGEIIAEFEEQETGKLNSRPELAKALHRAKVTGATLLIAKLDRLSRNAAFLLTLQDSGVKFIAADMPQANNLTVLGNPNGAAALQRAAKGNTAAVATIKHQADKQSASWLSWHSRKQKPYPSAPRRRYKQPSGAERHAEHLKPVIDSFKSEGIVSLGAIATALNERGMLTPRGGTWHKTSVKNLLTRLAS